MASGVRIQSQPQNHSVVLLRCSLAQTEAQLWHQRGAGTGSLPVPLLQAAWPHCPGHLHHPRQAEHQEKGLGRNNWESCSSRQGCGGPWESRPGWLPIPDPCQCLDVVLRAL